MSNFWLVLTAAITPDPAFVGESTAFPMTLTDPTQRVEQYRRALGTWRSTAHAAGVRLVVVETSGAVRADLLDPDDETVFVPFRPDSELPALGKGAVETAALDEVFNTVAGSDADTVAKVTGRLTIANASRLLTPCPSGVLRARRSIDRRFIDSRFLVTTAGFWRQHLWGMATEVHDDGGRYLEHVLARRMILTEFEGSGAVERFVEPPRILGSSGTTGEPYRLTLAERIVPPRVQKKAEGALRRLSIYRQV